MMRATTHALRPIPIVLAGLACLLANGAFGATLTQKKLGGSGPIDRPTALSAWWCASGWACAEQDTFVADGDSATVKLTARNFDPIGGLPMDVRLDNFVVVERSVYDANLLPIGETRLGDYPCANGNAMRPALDIEAILPAGAAYGTRFDGQIGPEWTYDPVQIQYEVGNCAGGGLPMWDDPFQTAVDGSNCPVTTTGRMRLGNGSGPEFVEAELQLSGLTPGTAYVVSYWLSSNAQDDIPLSQCPDPNDDFEVEIFGEELVCAPDLPGLSIAGLRTLAWDPATSIWRFQVVFRNTGSGPANSLGVTLEDASGGVEILQSFAYHGDAPPTGRGVLYSGPLEADLSGFPWVTGLGPYLLFLFDYEDDCGDIASQYLELQAGPPPSYPTSTPAPRGGTALDQNVPNPFNPRTTIEFELPRRGPVVLTVHDQRGRLVRRLVEGSRNAGPHAVVWDGRDDQHRVVAAGTYFYRLRTGGQQLVKRMVLLK